MRQFFFFVICACILAVSCVSENTTQNKTTAHSNTQLLRDKAVVEGDLRLVPIVSDIPAADLSSFTTLAEAMQIPGFSVLEQQQVGRVLDYASNVNHLTVSNKTSDTIIIMAGEVVTGGHQDRVIAQDYVIMPRSYKNVDVFCVEHGRWSPRGGSAVAPKASDYVFTGHGAMIAGNIRRGIYDNLGQQEVWDRVAVTTTDLEANSSTQTYNAIAEKKQFQTAQKAFETKALAMCQEMGPQLRGYAMFNGNIFLAADVFGDADLACRQIKVLLPGYYVEGLRKQEVKSKELNTNAFLQWVDSVLLAKDIAAGTSYNAQGQLLHAGR